MRKTLSGTLCVLLLALAGCDTDPATSVDYDSAVLHGDFKCSTDTYEADVQFELSAEGTGTWVRVGPLHHFVCNNEPNVDKPIPDTEITSLASEQAYLFRIVDAGGRWYDSNGEQYGTAYDGFTTDQAPQPPSGFTPGIVSGADYPKGSRVAQNLGADLARVEVALSQWNVCAPGAPRTNLDNTFTLFANRGVRVLLLAGFHSGVPSQAQAQQIGCLANRYGTNGEFWASYSGTDLPIRHIEFGNETSMAHQYPCPDPWYTSECFRSRANWYALRTRDAAQSIPTTRNVGLLVQADHGGSGNSVWVDEMYEAVPNLHDFVDGWTIHPYGPNWNDKPTKAVQQTQAKGAPPLPIDITETGFSSRNGQPVSNNYGWPTNQTYQQAADALNSVVNGLRNSSLYGSRIRHFMVYATYDLRAVSAGTEREWFFGAVTDTEAPKGAYTTAVSNLLDD
jgi:hypothetical protein